MVEVSYVPLPTSRAVSILRGPGLIFRGDLFADLNLQHFAISVSFFGGCDSTILLCGTRAPDPYHSGFGVYLF